MIREIAGLGKYGFKDSDTPLERYLASLAEEVLSLSNAEKPCSAYRHKLVVSGPLRNQANFWYMNKPGSHLHDTGHRMPFPQ